MTSGITLALDGSTYAGSAAVIRDGLVVAERALADVAKPGRGGREELFLPMVAECLNDAGVRAADLSRIVCGGGPGSFTSLRVAASIAKGFAVGRGIPLFSVSSLLLLVSGNPAGSGIWLAALPAMRGEVFAAPFEVHASGHISFAGEVATLPEEHLVREAEKIGGSAIGPMISPEWRPHARGVAGSLSEVIAAGPVDVNTWEPAYGRLAEAQVKWEAAHGRPLKVGG